MEVLRRMSKTAKFSVVLLSLAACLFTTYIHYIPIRISNCTEIGSDSPEGLFLDGFYVYDGPNQEVDPLPYRIYYIASWSELPSILAHKLNGDVCEYWRHEGG